MSNPSNALEGHTVKELLDEVCSRIVLRQGQTGRGSASRNYALAVTAVEDAQMRYTRGRAIEKGCFKPGDLDR